MSRDDLDARIAALESRLHAAEDQLAIQNLLMAYGPLVDSASAEEAGKLWEEGAVTPSLCRKVARNA
ncbi:nuclear transport factor 2 family protein [Novosphingobium panipatense]|uniref:hypothetical protein n=1 Tax=Novosphingobium panipatense TaxID=428991 RepID=UPI003609A5B6